MHRSRDRVARTLRHQEPDRLPFDAVGCGVAPDPDALPEEVCEYYRTGEFRYLSYQPPGGHFERFAPYLPGLPPGADLSYWGISSVPLTTAEGFHAGHSYGHPLAGVDTVAGLHSYPFPCPEDCPDPSVLMAEVAAAKAEGFTVVGSMSQTILETAYLLRGMEQLFVDFAERPEYVHELFAILGQWRQFQARAFGAAGVDVLRLGDDIATQQGLMVSPATYRQFIRSRHAATIAAARQVRPDLGVLYHSDGNLTPLLPDLIEIGVTAINPVQAECMDLREVKRDFGRDLTLWGCLPVQSVYASGTATEVEEQLDFLRGEIAPGGGLVLQFYNIVTTPRVTANVQAFFSAYYRGLAPTRASEAGR
ncbi:MAG: hypothetical protein KKI08_00370 [Armatimonadetes bacterium]|nr:hypothetical protein [Armatimonadota bacterium]